MNSASYGALARPIGSGRLVRFLMIPLLLAWPFGAGAAESVGTVTRVQNQAQIGATTAVAGSPVHMNDRLRTGDNARLQVTFRDKSVLTLGENANVVWSTALSTIRPRALAKSP